jgi:hypothetical protein
LVPELLRVENRHDFAAGGKRRQSEIQSIEGIFFEVFVRLVMMLKRSDHDRFGWEV